MDLKDVESLAKLARIELAEDEKVSLLADMRGILEYVKQIENVNTENVETEYKAYNVWREDEIRREDNSLDLIVSQFPDAQDGFLKVKKIL